MPMRPRAPHRGLGHTTNSGRRGGRVVLVIHPRYHHCARHVNLRSTLSCGVTGLPSGSAQSPPWRRADCPRAGAHMLAVGRPVLAEDVTEGDHRMSSSRSSITAVARWWLVAVTWV